jgi:hypothetical protein
MAAKSDSAPPSGAGVGLLGCVSSEGTPVSAVGALLTGRCKVGDKGTSSIISSSPSSISSTLVVGSAFWGVAVAGVVVSFSCPVALLAGGFSANSSSALMDR